MVNLRLATLVAVIAACSSAAPPPSSPPTPVADATYQATIRWTSYGIPHIVADDFAGLGFGQGYAFAKHHLCILADQIVRIRGERARYFGPGDNDVHVNSDFGYLALGLRERAATELASASAQAQAVINGYVAGYNKYLADTGVADLPAPCRGAAWVKPIDGADLVAYAFDIAIMASGDYLVEEIGSAQPHTDKSASAASQPTHHKALASNGWAIGAERSTSGHGLLVANPHFPWEGPFKFYEAHLTIPGELDAYGVNLLGMPLLSIAFNKELGWTHTFSASRQFMLYRIKLDPDDPTRYRYGDGTRAMIGRLHSIGVRQPDGSVASVERKLYHSHYGPMVDGASLRWDASAGTAFTLRDAAADKWNAIDQYIAMMRATDLDSFKAAMARYQSTPFVNTIYADRDGNVFYVDGSRIPNLSDAAIMAWQFAARAIPAVKSAWDHGVIVTDGTMPMFEWQDDPAAVADGTIAFARAPQLTRRDFVCNANDSYWMTNPASPLVGYSPFYGEAETTLSPRTRMNLTVLTDTGATGPAGADGKFDAAELERAILDNRSFTAKLLRDQVVERCRAAATGAKPPTTIGAADLARACATLAAWDGRYDLDSVGAILWRELLSTFPMSDYSSGKWFADKFDPARPVATPRDLAPAPSKGDDPIVGALIEAVKRLRNSDIDPITATLRQHQFVRKGDKRLPIHGGIALDGVTNKTTYFPSTRTMMPGGERGALVNSRSGLTKAGYPINYGTSYLLVLHFTDDGPEARALMTYSASSDPASPHFADQTAMFADKQLRPVLFTEAAIAADANLVIEKISGD